MAEEHFTKEKRVLVAMRKTLGAVIKDVTPSNSAFKSPLSETTIEDVKMCFGLIAAREREIAEEAGVEIRDRPQFTDETNKDNVVSIASLRSSLPGKNSKEPTNGK
ncbi:MAG TPA: segregation and condensation protein A [Gammaproteobacteria bacterium]|nr:segregation and condensation protein A [Gammaproteobacteria bacterium]